MHAAIRARTCSVQRGTQSIVSAPWRVRAHDLCAHRLCVAKVEAADVSVPKVAVKAAKKESKYDDEGTPTLAQVQGLLNVLVDETSIAELYLEMGSFELKVRRGVAVPAAGAAPPAHVAAAPFVDAAPTPVAVTPEESIDESIDEGVMTIESPKVGIFHRGRYAGGKRVGKGNCVNERDQIKKGQTLGYIEQLGTHVAVESPQRGEVLRFLVEDGAAVEYMQPLAELSPFFGGSTSTSM